MTEFTYRKYKIAFQKTPAKIKDVLFADETAQAIGKISLRQNANDKNFDIAAVVGYALVGLVPIKRFIQALQEDGGLDEKTAKNVAHDVRAEIFAPVAKELAAMQEEAERQWTQAHSDKSEARNPKSETNPNDQNSKSETGGSPMQAPTPKDESVVSEVFPAPEVDDKKFDDGLEKPEEK